MLDDSLQRHFPDTLVVLREFWVVEPGNIVTTEITRPIFLFNKRFHYLEIDCVDCGIYSPY